MNKGFITLLSSLFFITYLSGQPVNITCVDFNQFPAGLLIGPALGLDPGEVILGEEGLNVTIEEILYSNGNTGFGNATVNNDGWFGLDGNYIFMGNNSLMLNFSAAGGAVQEVCFDFVDGGGEENFAVNGSPVSVVQDFDEILGLTFPNASVTITELNNPGGIISGVVCVTGVIESLLVGGQEFGVDNVCFGTNTDCGILNLNAEIVECNDDGSYDIDVDFDHLSTSPNVAGFDILMNDEIVDFIEAGTELPYTLTGIVPGNNSNGNLTFLGAAGPFTQLPYSAALFGPAIPDNGLGGIVVNAYDDSADPSRACNDIINANEVAGNIALIDRGSCPFEQKSINAEAAGAIGVIICNHEDDLILMNGLDNVDDPAIPTVMLEASDCEFIRNLMEEEEVIVGLQPDSEGFELTVCENDNPDCCSTITIEPDCPDDQPSDCITFDGLLEGSVYGGSVGTPAGTPFFNENGVSMFLLPYQTLFWTTTYGDINILDAASNSEMAAATGSYIQFESVNAVFDLTGYSEPIDSITLDFYYTGGGINLAANGAAFLIQNNLQAGFYGLAPGITVQVVFDNNSMTEGQLIFTGNVQTLLVGGEGDFRIDNLCINPTAACDITDLVVEASPCNPNNVFSVDLDFNHVGTSDTFMLSIDGDMYGYYSYDDLPITLSPFVGPTENMVFEVVDASDTNCSASTELLAVNCEPCSITLWHDFNAECNPAGGYDQTINLNLVSNLNDLFVVTSLVTGYTQTLGYSNPSPNPDIFPLGLDLNNWPIPAQGYDEISVCLIGQPACCATTLFQTPAPEWCDPCPLEEIDFREGPFCFDDGTVGYMEIDVIGAEIGDVLFITIPEADYSETVVYEGIFNPINFTFPVSGSGTYELIVCGISTNAIDECCLSVPFTLDCGECLLSNLVAEPTPCDDNGQYYLEVDFDYQNTSDSFNLFVFLDYEGVYAYEDLPLQVGPFDTSPFGFMVGATDVGAITGGEYCAVWDTLPPYQCEDLCALEAINMIDVECDYSSDMTFVCNALFEIIGATEGDSLIVSVDGVTFFEVYNGQFLDVNVPCFPNSSLHTIEVCLITADGASDCCIALDFEIDCNQNCPLESIEFIVPPTCLAPGESYYYASFEVIGAEVGDLLTITSSSSNVTYTEVYNGQLVDVEIPLTDLGMDILTICTVAPDPINNIECCISVEFDIACPSCEIYDLVLEPYCDGDSLYYFDIDFVVEGIFADTFVLDMDNGFHAQFLYDDLPVTFGPFQSTGENLFVWLYDFDGECGTNTYFQTPDCLDGCVLGAVTSPVASAGCNNDGTYNIPLTIENAQIGDFFYVYSQLTNHADTITYGVGTADVLQISNWPSPSQGYDELTICLYDNPDCCVEYGFEVPCITDCVFEDWGIWLDSCVGSEAYLYVEAFSNTPNTVGYGVTVGNVTIGGLSFNEGHIVGPFPVNGTGIMGVELVHPDCVIYEEVSVEGCIDPPCELPLLEVSTECGNASAIVFFEFYDVPFNSWYYVEIPEANISDTLFLGGPTTFPLTIPLPAPDVSLTFDVLICDLFNPDCCEVYTVLVECPPACIIGSDLYNPGAICEQGSDLYSAEILVSGLVEGDSVVITSLETGYTTAYAFVPNGNIGTFYWMDISLLMPIPPNGYDVLEICSADDPNCCTIMEFPVDCFGCGIEDVAWEYECLEDGSFYITIYDLAPNSPLTVNYFFETPGYPGEEFYLSNLPITYGPYNTGPNQDSFVFEVSQADCEPYVEEFIPDCNIAGCLFTNVVIEPHSCDDGYFMMDVDVTVNDPGALGYYIIVDGGFYGPFNYSEPYVTIGPFEGDGATIYDVLILDIEDLTCSWYTELDPVDCNNTGGCDITDLQVTTLDCTPGGTYGIVVDFEVENPGNSFFEVFGPDGEPLGYYPLFIRPVTIQGIEPIEPGLGTITVCINDNPNCCASQSIIVPDCPSECEILDVSVEFAYCDTAGFYVQLDFAVDNPQSNGYSVVGNGENYGNFSYNQPMPIIGPFSPFTDNIYELVVTDLEDDDCSGFVEFPAFDCDYDCEIGAIVEGTNCTSDSTYFIVLGVDVVNPNSYFVDVYTSAGDFLGFYPITVDGYVLIEGVPYTNVGFLELVVCVNDNPDCCTSVTVQEPNCGEDCVISNVEASFAYCENDSFYVQLDFSYVNPVSDGYAVVGNGMNYGTYSYDEPFPVIGPFASNANQVYELGVFDLEDDNCSSFTEFPAFSCVQPECIALEEVGQQVYNLESGYEDGSLLFETPIANVYMETLDNNCNNCTVEIADASNYPDFTDAEGNVLELQPGGIELVFGNTDGYTQQFTFDFGVNIDSIMVAVNGSDYITVHLYDAFTSLPGGVSMVIDSYNWPAGTGTITFTGPIESLGIYTLEEFPIDNICLLEYMDDNDCIEFAAFDHLTYWDTLRLNDYGVPESMQLVENGVSMEGTSIPWGNNNDYFGGIYVSTENVLCGLETEGAKLFIDGGIAFDFTPTPQSDVPNSISFDLGLCFNLSSDVIYMEINGESFIGSPFDFPTMVAGVLIEGEQIGISFWNITLTGDLEEFVLGGQNITLDNICFATIGQPIIEVWPGDANADNLAHHVDLLNIGIAYGDVGPYRPEDGTSWIGMDALNWNSSFANGINYKHADCNGDGIIDWSDRMVIEQNYGLSHGPSQEIESLPFTDLDPPVFVDFNSEIPSGTGFNVPIIAGTEDSPLDDIYGIAFTVEFDPELLPPGDIQIIYPTSWFGEPEVNSMTIDRTYAQEGIIEIAMTRIDHNNVSGYGPVAYIIGVIDDIAGLKADTDIMVTKVKAIDKDEKRIPISTPPTIFSIISKGDDGDINEEANGIFSVYPNPASRWINVTSRHGFEPEELTLINANGQVLDVPQENNNRISLESVPAGTYVLRIRSGKTQVHKLIVRQ
ncbi:MAG: T9SS type A sorting domain-containing protein [Chitinophagales bacterium]|nr:T9SS type A sorting domain-containing protein [Chitinophagales bacterium]